MSARLEANRWDLAQRPPKMPPVPPMDIGGALEALGPWVFCHINSAPFVLVGDTTRPGDGLGGGLG